MVVQLAVGSRCERRRRFGCRYVNFLPGLWVDPLLESGIGFGVVCPESGFAGAVSYGSKIEDLPISSQVSRFDSARMFGPIQLNFVGIRMLLDA